MRHGGGFWVVGTVLAMVVWGFVGGGVCEGAGAREVDVRARLEVGVERRFHGRVSSEMSIDLMGQTREMGMEKEYWFRYEVIEAEPGAGGRVLLVHERIRLEASGEVPGTFDSDDKPGPDGDGIYGRLLRPLVGAELTLEVNGRGEIVSVDGLEAARPRGAMESSLFAGLFGESEIRAMYGALFGLKPDGDGRVRVGEAWEIRRESSSGIGTSSTTLTMEVARVRGDDATVEIGGATEIGGVAVETSEITGRAVWDVERGVLRRLETRGVTTFAPDDGNTMGVAVTGEARSETVLEEIDASGR